LWNLQPKKDKEWWGLAAVLTHTCSNHVFSEVPAPKFFRFVFYVASMHGLGKRKTGS